MKMILAAILLSFQIGNGYITALQEPAPGEWCDRDSGSMHPCECQRECKKNVECDEEGADCHDVPGVHVQEDSKCKAYCKPKQCGCPVKNCDSTEADHGR